jgi:hypothetical protein
MLCIAKKFEVAAEANIALIFQVKDNQPTLNAPAPVPKAAEPHPTHPIVYPASSPRPYTYTRRQSNRDRGANADGTIASAPPVSIPFRPRTECPI